MPPFITWPTSGAPMGPGFSFRVGTDTPGVPIVGTFWRIKLEGEGGTAPLFGEWRFPTQGLPTLEYYLSSDAFALGSDLIADPRYPQGATIRMQVAITSEGSVIESVEQPVKIDYTSGAPRIITEKQASISGGLTVEQAAQLETTTAAMGFMIGGGALDAIGNLIGIVGQKLITSELITPDRQGSGSLQRPGPLPGVNAYGIAWQAVTWPEGIGIDEGNPQLLEVDYLQLSEIVQRGAAGDVTRNSFYVREINGTRTWLFDYPFRIDYYITPGVSVRFWWQVLQFGGLELASALANRH